MINRVVLTGRLTDDPELRYTSQGTAVVAFRLAVNRQFRNQDGSRDADFINCVVWRKSAENFANFTHKGSLVGIDGRLSTRNYENKQGQKVYVTEVTVENFALLEPKNGNQSNYNNQQNNYNNGANQSAFNQQGENVDLSTLPFNNDKLNGSAPEIDDVPF
ncbi:single-stranded DNA-binding protein [uncultured Limosilactobacillus sp.]|uniref:single-stranded DNA-binding protein n=1 Tax=uncultured Limosilactobacillus sp. TaxID=2837629 RepID=UPI0025DF0D02|nr:single-stranded DNA-binding protein [uncultured Limosilactobacillus sp.]